MDDFTSFSSYELTHDNKKASNGGCLSGCATIIAGFIGIVGIIFVVLITIIF